MIWGAISKEVSADLAISHFSKIFFFKTLDKGVCNVVSLQYKRGAGERVSSFFIKTKSIKNTIKTAPTYFLPLLKNIFY